MFPGRWQPLHQGHMQLIDQELKEEKNVWIGIRDTEISERNPYTIKQRMEMIKRAYGDLYGIESWPLLFQTLKLLNMVEV